MDLCGFTIAFTDDFFLFNPFGLFEVVTLLMSDSNILMCFKKSNIKRCLIRETKCDCILIIKALCYILVVGLKIPLQNWFLINQHSK